MVQGYEIVALLLGLTAMVVILLNQNRLGHLHAHKLLIGAFSLFLASWFFTNLEAFLWRETFNLLEHVSQALAGILTAAWCWVVFRRGKEER